PRVDVRAHLEDRFAVLGRGAASDADRRGGDLALRLPVRDQGDRQAARWRRRLIEPQRARALYGAFALDLQLSRLASCALASATRDRRPCDGRDARWNRFLRLAGTSA